MPSAVVRLMIPTRLNQLMKLNNSKSATIRQRTQLARATNGFAESPMSGHFRSAGGGEKLARGRPRARIVW